MAAHLKSFVIKAKSGAIIKNGHFLPLNQDSDGEVVNIALGVDGPWRRGPFAWGFITVDRSEPN